MENIVGCWKLDLSKQSNVDEFFKAAEAPAEFQEKLKKREYQVTYGKDGDQFTCKVKILNDPDIPEKDYSFCLGKEADMTSVDGLKYKACITWDGSKFIEKYSDPKGMEFTTVKEINGDTMTTETTMKGVTMKQVWNRC